MNLTLALITLGIDYVNFRQVIEPRVTPAAEEAAKLAGWVQEDYQIEAQARGISGTGTAIVPLTWSEVDGNGTDEPEANGGLALGEWRRRLGGRIDADVQAAMGKLAARYRKVPAGRLVVLGEPGAGKSGLVLLLALGLLTRRQAGQAVPALVSIAAWDPYVERRGCSLNVGSRARVG